MTKHAVIAIVVGMIIILSAAGVFLYSKTKPTTPNDSTVATQISPTIASNMQSSITEILSTGETAKCSFTIGEDESQTTGTIYTSGDKAKGDFSTTVNGKENKTYMIKDADTFYLWGDSLPMGIKMAMSVNDFASKASDNPLGEAIDPSKEFDVKCVSWTRDESIFNPPTTVKFTSFGSTAPTGTTRTTGTVTPTSAASSDNTNECNICNSLTGAAKTACVAQFKCQ